MSYLFDFRIDEPPHKLQQTDSFEWLAAEYARSSAGSSIERYQALLHRVGAKPSQIASRGHYLPDFAAADANELKMPRRRLFTGNGLPQMQDRMLFFDETAGGILERLLVGRSEVDDLLHVTCTGYVSPSAAQRWVLKSRAHQRTSVAHLYHMGCYAALPAIKQAQSLAMQNRKVEICHTELCTLHLHPSEPSLEDMVVQTLFADGACAYRAQLDRPAGASLRHHSSHEELLPDTAGAMTWALHESGFKMTLSKDVPGLVKKSLPAIMKRWLGDRLDLRNPRLIWAIHPGGPKIIDEIRMSFDLGEKQVTYSQAVLKERGNMSSATLPHIWDAILRDPEVADGTQVLTMAFGPGLTVSLAHLEVQR